MKFIDFNIDKPTPEKIDKFYNQYRNGIEAIFDSDLNPNLENDFPGLSDDEREQMKNELLEELSLRSSFYLLAYIETLFRTDFALRLETSNKKGRDVLTKAYRSIYNSTKRIYTYSLVDVIFKNWKNYVVNKPNSKEMQDILRNLPQYFDFRNWMAHGRYWTLRDSNYARKYKYTQTQLLLEHIDLYFGEWLKKK